MTFFSKPIKLALIKYLPGFRFFSSNFPLAFVMIPEAIELSAAEYKATFANSSGAMVDCSTIWPFIVKFLMARFSTGTDAREAGTVGEGICARTTFNAHI